MKWFVRNNNRKTTIIITVSLLLSIGLSYITVQTVNCKNVHMPCEITGEITGTYPSCGPSKELNGNKIETSDSGLCDAGWSIRVNDLNIKIGPAGPFDSFYSAYSANYIEWTKSGLGKTVTVRYIARSDSSGEYADIGDCKKCGISAIE